VTTRTYSLLLPGVGQSISDPDADQGEERALGQAGGLKACSPWAKE